MLDVRSLCVRISVLTVMLAAAGSTSCFDPVHSDAVDALGGEVDGVETGPEHRPGQPCRVCHGGDGPGAPELTFAGTVYLYRDRPEPAEGTRVEIREAKQGGKKITLVSNRVGNFYVSRAEFSPQFPVFVTLFDDRIKEVPAGMKEMVTPIGRNGGCGFCHAAVLSKADAKSLMPHVYLDLAPSQP